MMQKNIKIIPILKNRYVYHISKSKKNYLIDAGDYEDIYEFIKEKDLSLDFILCTHHHVDHTDGILKLKQTFNCEVYGPNDTRVKNLDHFFPTDQISNFQDIFEVIPTPGHTKTHLIYYLKSENTLFTGDLLFKAGCGKVFEGSYKEMFNSLKKIKQFPLNTLLFFGHEYTVKNLEFAFSIEPENEKIKQSLLKARKKQFNGEYTTPSNVECELKINPFLRTNCVELKKSINMLDASELEVFTYLRKLKDKY